MAKEREAFSAPMSSILCKLEKTDEMSLKQLPRRHVKISHDEKINYDEMKRICALPFNSSEPEEHNNFMKSYPQIVRKKEIKWANDIVDNPLSERMEFLAQAKKIEIQDINYNHNISDHLSRLRSGRVSPTASVVKETRIKGLRRYGRKQPFERTRKDNHQLFQHLRPLRCFESISDELLLSLCPHAYNEKWTKEEIGFTVLESTALHIIIKGSVLISQASEKSKSPTRLGGLEEIQEDSSGGTLFAGDWFGSLEGPSDGHSTRLQLGRRKVTTLEPCEFLKIHSDAYHRMIKVIEQKDLAEKLEILSQCPLFSAWPTLSLRRVCDCLLFYQKQPGEVLAEEGSSSDFLYIIKKGECVVRRTLDTVQVNPDGTSERKAKMATIDELGPGDSIGQESVIGGISLEATVICRSPVVVACLPRASFQTFDDVTLKLLQHRYEDLDKKTSTETIQSQYIENQLQVDWKRFKTHVIADVVHYQGILPGQGKWARNPTRFSS